MNESSRDSKKIVGDAIRQGRLELGLTLKDVSDRLRERGLSLGTSTTHLSSVERGDSWPSVGLMRALESALDCADELVAVLRDAKVPSRGNSATVDAEIITYFAGKTDGAPLAGDQQVAITELGAVHHSPYGVVVVETRRAVRASNLTEVARQRAEVLAAPADTISSALTESGSGISLIDDEPYGLSCLILREHPWDDDRPLDAAVRLLSCPSLLAGTTFQSEAATEQHESALLRAGVVPDAACFSVPGAHLGYATWSAVSLHPLRGTEIVGVLRALQIELQALWCYASYCHRTGTALPGYSASFLAERLRQLQAPRPNDHITVRLLRDALVSTSRVAQMVESAVGSLMAARKGTA